jgi:hypothetical protein
MNRSTNHGIVILATYLVGAMAIDAPLTGRDALREVVRQSFGQGYYPEGLGYMQFCMSELMPYLSITWDGEKPWREHVATELPGLAGAKTMMRVSAGKNGTIRATFGDMGRSPKIYRNVTVAVDSLSDQGDLASVLSGNRSGDHAHLGPLTAPLPRGGRCGPGPRSDAWPPGGRS